MPHAEPVRFGPHVLDPATGELRRAGRPVRVQRQVFDAIRFFCAQPDVLHTREALHDALWPDAIVADDALSQLIRKVRIALDDTEPPHRYLKTVPRRGYRFVADVAPVAPTPELFGRQPDLAAIIGASDRLPVVAICGTGGMGKSHLLRVVIDQLRAGSDDAVLVDLEQIDTPERMVRALAAALGVPLGDRSDEEALSRIGRALAARGRVVVALDDLDLVGRAAEPAIAAWRDQAPEVRWLLTSRRPPELPDTEVVALGPLPPEGARALFRERAAAVGVVLPADDPDLDALVARLDHSPLAIELAAARSRLFGIPELRRRLEDRFQVLRDRHGARPDRHRSVYACLLSSWERLEPETARALAALTALPGPFDASTAEALLARAGIAGDPLDRIEDLRLAALLHQSPDGSLRLLESVADLARERPETADARRRALAVRVDALVARNDALAQGAPASDERLRVIALLVALLDGVDAPDALAAVLGRLGRWLREADALQVGRRALDRALPHLDRLEPEDRAALLLARAHLVGDPRSTRDALVSEAQAAARAAGRPDLELEARLIRARAATNLGGGDAAATAEVLADARALARADLLAQAALDHGMSLLRGARVSEAWDLIRAVEARLPDGPDRAVLQLGGANALAARGYPDEAMAWTDRARATFRRLGWRLREAISLANLAGELVLHGRRELAIRVLDDARGILRTIGERNVEAAVLINLAVQHLFERDTARARACLDSAAALARAEGNDAFAATITYNRATAAWLDGDLSGALEQVDAAHRLSADADMARQVGLIEAWRAGILAAMGRDAEAREALDRARGRLEDGDRFAAEVLSVIAHHVADTDPHPTELEGPRAALLGELLRRRRAGWR